MNKKNKFLTWFRKKRREKKCSLYNTNEIRISLLKIVRINCMGRVRVKNGHLKYYCKDCPYRVTGYSRPEVRDIGKYLESKK